MSTSFNTLQQVVEGLQTGFFAAEGNGLTTDEAQRLAAMINNYSGKIGFAPFQIINGLRQNGVDERSIQQVQQWL